MVHIFSYVWKQVIGSSRDS